jgi:type I restriction enzyme S subunit
MKNVLPENWIETTLEVVLARITNGSNLRQKEEPFKGSYPISRIETIWNETIDLNRVKYVEPSLQEIEKYGLIKGDVLFSHINSDKHLGKTAIYDLEEVMIHGINLLLLRTVPQYDDKLFNYVLRHMRFKGVFINAAQRSVNQSSINQKKLKAFNVPLIPVLEQKRIVAKLDSLFAHLEEVKTRLSLLPKVVGNLKQKLLTQAFSGELSKEWSSNNSASDWKDFKMLDLITSIQAGKNFKCPEIPVEKGKVGLVKISAVTWGEFDPKQTKTVIDQDRINEDYFIKEGDFLISRANTIDLVGAPVIVKTIEYDIMISDKVWRVGFKNNLHKAFINHYLKSRQGRGEIESRASGNQESMRNLSQNGFKDISVPIPSDEEIQIILDKLESNFSKLDKIEKAIVKLSSKTDKLPAAILSKAFRGELVEQLSSDGDARDLLKEIEKSNILQPKKGQKKSKIHFKKSLSSVLKLKNEIKFIIEKSSRGIDYPGLLKRMSHHKLGKSRINEIVQELVLNAEIQQVFDEEAELIKFKRNK